MAIAKKILGKAIKKTRQEFGKPKVEKKIKITAKEAKANKRGLKAANKPRGLKYTNTKGKTVKSKNIKLDREISDINAYMAATKQYQSRTGRTNDVIYGTDNVLKYTPPARPNRIRGGSMKSKLNFPKGMK